MTEPKAQPNNVVSILDHLDLIKPYDPELIKGGDGNVIHLIQHISDNIRPADRTKHHCAVMKHSIIHRSERRSKSNQSNLTKRKS